MGLIDHQQRVGRQVVEQGRRRGTGFTARQVARVVFDAVAVPQLHDHFQIEAGALLKALGFHQLIVGAQVIEALLELFLDALNGIEQGFARGHVVAFGVEGEARHLADHFTGQRVEGADALDLIVKQLDADGFEVGFGRVDVDDVAAYAERGAGEVHVVTGVLQVSQATQQFTLVEFVAAVNVQHHFQIGFGAAQAVDARHRGDDNRVLALQQRLGRGQSHLLDVIVDRGVLLNEGVGGGHVRFGLVIVVIRNEVFHGVVGEERLELAIQLGRQGFVGCEHQGRAVHVGNHVGDAEGLARTGHPEQGLVRQAGFDAFNHLANGFGLIACGLKAGNELKIGHI